MPVSLQTIGQIETHLRSFETACAEQDVPRLAALLHRDVHGFLPYPGDAFSSREELLGIFSSNFLKGLNPALCIFHERIDADGVVAWVSAQCRLTLPSPKGACHTIGRATLVFRGTGHAWTIAQLHVSLPEPLPETLGEEECPKHEKGAPLLPSQN